MAIVPMWQIVIHHVSGSGIHRKMLRYLDEESACAYFNALRDYWTPQPNDYHYKLIDPNGTILDQFEARTEDA